MLQLYKWTWQRISIAKVETNEGGPIYPPIRKSIISSVSLSVLRGFQDGIDPRRPVSVFNPFKASTFASFRPTFRPLITIPDPLFELLSVLPLLLLPFRSLCPIRHFSVPPFRPSALSRRPVTVQPIPWLIAHGSAGDVSNCTVCRCVSKRVSRTISLFSSNPPFLSPCPHSRSQPSSPFADLEFKRSSVGTGATVDTIAQRLWLVSSERSNSLKRSSTESRADRAV